MTTALSTFNFAPGMALRVIDRDGEPWFVAKDVCDVLGYTNVSAALSKHVDDDDRAPLDTMTITNRESQRRAPRISIINESGLYSLVMGSKLPAATLAPGLTPSWPCSSPDGWTCASPCGVTR